MESRLSDPRRLSNKRKYENYKNDIDYVELDSNTNTKKRQYSSIIDSFNNSKNSISNTNSFIDNNDPLISNNDPLISNGNPLIGNGDPLIGNGDSFINLNDPLINSNEPIIGAGNTFTSMSNPYNINMIPHHFSTNQMNEKINENMTSIYKSNQVLLNIIEKQNSQIAFFESQQDKMKSMEKRIDELEDINKEFNDKNKILKKKVDKFEITRKNFNEDYEDCKLKFEKILSTIHDIFNKYPSLYKISKEDNIIVSGKMDGYNYDKSGNYINGIHIIVPLNIFTNLFVNNQFLLQYNSNLGLDTEINNWDKVRIFCPKRISFKKNLKIGEPVKLQIFTNAIPGKKDSTIGMLLFNN
tara:strand:- start:5199 stop:6263 length:1065 start_codon:yes stop_codon:yes gene_type:complete